MQTSSVPRAGALRAMANALSAAVLVIALVFAFSEGVPKVWQFSSAELAQLTSFVLMLTGLAVGLFLPPVGGMLTLAGFAAFWGVNIMATGVPRLGGAFALFPIAAVLQLAVWWQSRRPPRAGS